MSIRFASLLVICSLLGCAIQPAHESYYNQGVAAYRVKNYAVAREHWSKAADSGDASAQNNLGYLLYFGLGGEPDMDRALVLWKRAAVAGHSEAQWHLGGAFEDGKAVPESKVEAYAWYRCAIASAEAASEGGKNVEGQIAQDAHESLTALLARLSPDQFNSAEQLAKQYIASYAKRSGT